VLKQLFYIALLLVPSMLISQKHWKVTLAEITEYDTISVKTLNFRDSSDIRPYVRKFVQNQQRKNYPLINLDARITDAENKKITYFYFKGPKFAQLHLHISEEDKWLIRKIPRINERILAQVPISSGEISSTLNFILNYLENNGFPFARVRLEKLNLDPETPSAALIIDKGPKVSWKNVLIKGEPKIKPAFVQTYLGIKPGDLYSERQFRDIRRKVSQLVYLDLEQSPQIAFTEEGADLYLYLKTEQMSSANGILGIQPGQDGKVVFTGDIQLRFLNLLKHGEQVDLSWRSMQPQTQQIDFKLNYPFLFRTGFGVDGDFHLYKRDSTFLEIRSLAGIHYYIGRGNYLRGFYRFESSNVLSGAANNPQFAQSQNVRTNFYGIGLFRRQLDYLPNPRKGIVLDLDVSVGLRTAFPKDSAETVREAKSTTYRTNLQIDYFIPLGKRHVLRLANLTRFYYADTIYANEQIRFGGLNTQRGFDEEALFATTFTRFTLEYRFLLDRNSHLFAFFDQSFYENNSGNYYQDNPFGFGAGMAFGTKVGTFSISYALGRQFNNNIQLRDGKIHFGYIAFF
jgi:outer membrane protein assembly factor BamA